MTTTPRFNILLADLNGSINTWGAISNEAFRTLEAFHVLNPSMNMTLGSGADGSTDVVFAISGGDSGAHYWNIAHTTSGTLSFQYDSTEVFSISSGGIDFVISTISGVDDIFIDADGALYFGTDRLQHDSATSQLRANGSSTRYWDLNDGIFRDNAVTINNFIIPGASGGATIGTEGLPFSDTYTDNLTIVKDGGKISFGDGTNYLEYNDATAQLRFNGNPQRYIDLFGATFRNGTYIVNSTVLAAASGAPNVGSTSAPFSTTHTDDLRLNKDGSKIIFNSDNYLSFDVATNQLRRNGSVDGHWDFDNGVLSENTLIANTRLQSQFSGSASVGTVTLPFGTTITDDLRINKDGGRIIFNGDDYLEYDTATAQLRAQGAANRYWDIDGGVFRENTVIANVAVVPDASGGANIGSALAPFGDTYTDNLTIVKDGGKISFGDGSQYLVYDDTAKTLTNSVGTLIIDLDATSSASIKTNYIQVNQGLLADTDGGANLGTTNTAFATSYVDKYTSANGNNVLVQPPAGQLTQINDSAGGSQLTIGSAGLYKGPGSPVDFSLGLTIPDNKQLLFGDGTWGFQVDHGNERLNSVTSSTETATYYLWDANSRNIKPANVLAVGGVFGAGTTSPVNLGAGATVPTTKQIVTPTISGLAGERMTIKSAVGEHLMLDADHPAAQVQFAIDGNNKMAIGFSGLVGNADGVQDLGTSTTAFGTSYVDTYSSTDGTDTLVQSPSGQNLVLEANSDAGTEDIQFKTNSTTRMTLNGAGSLFLNTVFHCNTIRNLASAGPPSFDRGLSVTTSQQIVTPTISGLAGEALVFKAGNTAGDDILFKEGAGDGSTNRIQILGGSNIVFSDNVGATQMRVQAGGVSINTALLAGAAGTTSLGNVVSYFGTAYVDNIISSSGNNLVLEANSDAGTEDIVFKAGGATRLTITDGGGVLAGAGVVLGADTITDRTGTQSPNFSKGLTVPTTKQIVTPTITGLSGEQLTIRSAEDQNLVLEAYGDGTGDTADIEFRAGNGVKWTISQQGSLSSSQTNVDLVMFGNGVVRTEFLANSNEDGPPLLTFGSTESILESGSTAAVEMNIKTKGVQEITLTADWVPSFNNWPTSGNARAMTLITKQDATGGWAITFPGEVLWPGGITPIHSSGANDIDVWTMVSTDGGSSVYGFLGGSNFS